MSKKSRGNKSKIKFLLLWCLLFTLVVLASCGAPAQEPAAPAEPAATEEPVEPFEPSDDLPVQYGQDSRTELYQHTDAKLKELAASVAVLVYSRQVKSTGNSVRLDGYTLNEMSEMGWLVGDLNVPMCSSELFTSQPAPGFCTGFLVKDDILITAGHCLQKASCADTSIVFGFQMESGDLLASLSRENVFQCEEVIAQVLPKPENQFLDYAIIKLDRPTGRTGLSYATEDHLESQDSVAVLGHPSGLPMKIASDAFVMNSEANNPLFVTNLDTFGSNSGSPVINMSSYQVEGLLVSGVTDYVPSDDGSCVRVNRCPESGDAHCAGENATKMTMLAKIIPMSTTTGAKGINCLPNLALILVVIALIKRK